MAVLTRFRVVLATVLTLSFLLVLTAPPAAAETVLTSCVGTCGTWQVYDSEVGNKGAVCLYPNPFPYILDSIKVRPPLMYGAHSYVTDVSWRFRIQYKNGSGVWKTTYSSPYQVHKADDANPVYLGHGFLWGVWKAPYTTDFEQYRVIVQMQWWQNSFYGPIDGQVKLKYDWYKELRSNGDHFTHRNYCVSPYLPPG